MHNHAGFRFFFYRTIPLLTYKYIENILTKEGKMRSSHVNLAHTTQRLVGETSNINLEINVFMTREI